MKLRQVTTIAKTEVKLPEQWLYEFTQVKSSSPLLPKCTVNICTVVLTALIRQYFTTSCRV